MLLRNGMLALLLLALTASRAHAGCPEIRAALGDRVADMNCFESSDLLTRNPLTTPANNSLPALPAGAFTPTTDRTVISLGTLLGPDPVPGVQVNGRFANDPTGQARFLLRLPNSWNGKLVVAGASGTRSEFNGDFAWSDYVLQKGFAYASQNKGVLNLQVTNIGSATPPDSMSCRLNPLSVVWVKFYDTDPAKPFTQWTQYMIEAAELAHDAVKAQYPDNPARTHLHTYAVGTSNGGYQVRRAVEAAPGLFDGGVDWEGTFVDPNENILIDLPPALTAYPNQAPFYPPDITNAAGASLYTQYWNQFWEVTQCQWQKRFDPTWTTYPDGVGDISGTGGYDFFARAAADPSIQAQLAAVATTGHIKRPLVTVAGTMDALLPIERHVRAYEARTNGAHLPAGTDYRLYEVQNGNHIEAYTLRFPQLVLIQPHAQKAFDLLVDHVENGAPLPPSQCIPKGGAISGNPTQPGHCVNLLEP